MAGAREIRTKIKSVANTRKVTRALEMVSASKIRKGRREAKEGSKSCPAGVFCEEVNL